MVGVLMRREANSSEARVESCIAPQRVPLRRNTEIDDVGISLRDGLIEMAERRIEFTAFARPDREGGRIRPGRRIVRLRPRSLAAYTR